MTWVRLNIHFLSANIYYRNSNWLVNPRLWVMFTKYVVQKRLFIPAWVKAAKDSRRPPSVERTRRTKWLASFSMTPRSVKMCHFWARRYLYMIDGDKFQNGLSHEAHDSREHRTSLRALSYRCSFTVDYFAASSGKRKATVSPFLRRVAIIQR